MKTLEDFFKSIPEFNVEETTVSNVAAPSAAVIQSYARFETISRKNGKLYGCWSSSLNGACSEDKITPIDEGAILFQQYANNCSSGSAVHVVTYT